MKKYLLCMLFFVLGLCLFSDKHDRDYIVGKWKFVDNMVIRMIGMEEGIDFDVDTYMPYELPGILEFTKETMCYHNQDKKDSGVYNMYRHKNVSSCYYVDMTFENKKVIPYLSNEISLVIYIIDENRCRYCIYSNLIASIYTGMLVRIKD